MEKSNEYLGSVYTIYNLSGNFIFWFKVNMRFLHFIQWLKLKFWVFSRWKQAKNMMITRWKTSLIKLINSIKNSFTSLLSILLIKTSSARNFITNLILLHQPMYSSEIIHTLEKIDATRKYDTEKFYLFYLLHNKRIIKAQKKYFCQLKKCNEII